MWELDHKESWVQNWCFWTVVLEKTLESPLDCKKIKPVNPKGKSLIFTGRTDTEAETLILWPPDAKNWLIWRDPDAGKDWRQEKGTTEDEMVGWHHWLDRHEFEQASQVMAREVWCTAVHGVTKSQTRLSDCHYIILSLTAIVCILHCIHSFFPLIIYSTDIYTSAKYWASKYYYYRFLTLQKLILHKKSRD